MEESKIKDDDDDDDEFGYKCQMPEDVQMVHLCGMELSMNHEIFSLHQERSNATPSRKRGVQNFKLQTNALCW